MTRVAVVLPVGPEAHHARWLDEALTSLMQSRVVDHLVVVDDMHGRTLETLPCPPGVATYEVYRPPWRLGVAGAFNAGVARAFAAGCDLAVMLGADDRLSDTLVEALVRYYDEHGKRDGYYWFDVEYSDGETQRLACGAAAVTAGLWRRTGGFPPESGLGMSDSTLISALMVNHPEMLRHVPGCYYWVRRHEMQDTATGGALRPAREIVRDWYTTAYRPAQWGRY